mgnify:CR=1 FL=1
MEIYKCTKEKSINALASIKVNSPVNSVITVLTTQIKLPDTLDVSFILVLSGIEVVKLYSNSLLSSALTISKFPLYLINTSAKLFYDH